MDQGEEVTIEEADFLLKLAVHCESLLVAWDPNQGVKADQGSDLAGALRVRFRDLHRVELAVGHDTTEQLAETLVVLTRASENLGAIRQSGVKQSEWPPLLLEIQGSLTDVHVSCIEELNNLLNQGLTPRDFALLYRRGNPVGAAPYPAGPSRYSQPLAGRARGLQRLRRPGRGGPAYRVAEPQRHFQPAGSCGPRLPQ